MRMTQTKIATAEATQVPFLNFLAAVIIISQSIFRSLHVISLGFRKQMKKQNFCCIALPIQRLTAGLGMGWLSCSLCHPRKLHNSWGRGHCHLPVRPWRKCSNLPTILWLFSASWAVRLRELGSTVGLQRRALLLSRSVDLSWPRRPCIIFGFQSRQLLWKCLSKLWTAQEKSVSWEVVQLFSDGQHKQHCLVRMSYKLWVQLRVATEMFAFSDSHGLIVLKALSHKEKKS